MYLVNELVVEHLCTKDLTNIRTARQQMKIGTLRAVQLVDFIIIYQLA